MISFRLPRYTQVWPHADGAGNSRRRQGTHQNCRQPPGIKTPYYEGLVDNATFEEIEQKITTAFPEVKSPLVPNNVARFTERPDDFPNPAIAEHILYAYGEDRGDCIRRLYRFPVMLPADRWHARCGALPTAASASCPCATAPGAHGYNRAARSRFGAPRS